MCYTGNELYNIIIKISTTWAWAWAWVLGDIKKYSDTKEAQADKVASINNITQYFMLLPFRCTIRV